MLAGIMCMLTAVMVVKANDSGDSGALGQKCKLDADQPMRTRGGRERKKRERERRMDCMKRRVQ